MYLAAYNEIVNIRLSQLRRPRRSMMPAEISRTCYVCKKLFCCEQCRERHEEKKHAKRQVNCPLCSSQKLPLKSLEDNALLCHIASTHLPLYCCLCGEIFKHSKDLQSFGTCKWWQSRHRHSLVSERKSILGTPPFISEEKSSEYNSNYVSLTSPPELYRNTSTPMVVGQKTNFDFKTPSAPNFSLKTPKTNSASLKTDPTCSDSQASNYMSFPSSTSHEETPFRSLPINRANKEEAPRSNCRKLETMKNKDSRNPNEYYADNNCVEDMDLTNVEGEALPDSQSLGTCQREKRSDSLKKVRFSDQHENATEPSSTATFNVTENEEYFEACDTLSDTKESLKKSQIKIYEENARNSEKENRSPEKISTNGNQQSSGSSRVVMMVVVENNSNLSTSDLIGSGLKKLEHIASSTNLSVQNQSSPGGSSSVTSVDSYYSVTNHNYYSSPNEGSSPSSRVSNTSSNSSNDSNSSGGILSAVANAVKSVMKNFSGMGSSRNAGREIVSPREDIVPRPSTSDTFSTVSSLASSLLQRPGKRPRETSENSPPMQRPTEFMVPQIEIRSPIAKRQRGWYKVKAREPIARMRNNRQLTSPRGVSLETQVFHQGSLSVGDTVLPLPDRAHQSTQTE